MMMMMMISPYVDIANVGCCVKSFFVIFVYSPISGIVASTESSLFVSSPSFLDT